MNSDIKGWLENVSNPILKLLLGILILGIMAQWGDSAYQREILRKNNQYILAVKDKRIEFLQNQLAECTRDRFNDLKGADDRLKMRNEKADTAIKILIK